MKVAIGEPWPAVAGDALGFANEQRGATLLRARKGGAITVEADMSAGIFSVGIGAAGGVATSVLSGSAVALVGAAAVRRWT